MFSLFKTAQGQPVSLSLKRRGRRRSGALTACFLTLVLGPAWMSLSAEAQALIPDTYSHIYLYTSDNSTVDVTASYSFHDNHLFDPDGLQVGTGDANGQIWDSSSHLIGYLTYNGPIL